MSELNELKWLLDVLHGLGIGGGPLFLYLWWIEKRERQAAQKENRELSERVFTALAQSGNSTSTLVTSVAAMGDESREANVTLTQLVQLVRIFTSLLKKKGIG